MPTPQNQVKISIDVETNAPEQFQKVSQGVGQVTKAAQQGQRGLGDYSSELQQSVKGAQALVISNGQVVQGLVTAVQAFTAAEKAVEKYLSVMMRARLAAQEGMIGFHEAFREMEEDSLSLAEILSRAQLYIEDVGFSIGKVLEGVNKQFRATFTGEASFALKAGEEAFKSFHKSLDEGLTNVFAASFSRSTDNVKKTWEKFVESLEQSFYQSLGRMASALVQENLLAPAFKLAQGAAGALLEAGKSFLGLAQGGLVTKPTLALVGEAGDILFGDRGPGLLQRGLGALGLSAFRGRISPEAHGAGNFAQIGNILEGLFPLSA